MYAVARGASGWALTTAVIVGAIIRVLRNDAHRPEKIGDEVSVSGKLKATDGDRNTGDKEEPSKDATVRQLSQ